ncbi:MAG TPA: phosphatidate cytidylyltransferase [Alphaproteobacteria bacterium]|nr:phosphatidate cytidylyltransferase [Alphaproteobacteria bacterium]
MSSALMKRLLSSIILIPVVFGMIWWGGWAFGIFLAVCIGIAFAEWVNLAAHAVTSTTKRAAIFVIGFLYLALAFYNMADIRLNFPDGAFWILTLFLCIWSSDTLAYIFGKNIGGPKMTPTVSPNKTWSGYAGALLGPAITLSLCMEFFSAEDAPPLPITFVAGAILGIVGQSGDLLISFTKRKAGLKDTGNLIPGHGGILDRIDALLLVIPVFYAYLTIINMP